MGMFANKLPELVNLESYTIQEALPEVPVDEEGDCVVRVQVAGGATAGGKAAVFDWHLRRKRVGGKKGCLLTYKVVRVAQ